MKEDPALDAIRAGLAEVWESQGRRFVTFEASLRGRTDPELWVQYVDGRLNAAWPLDEEPAAALARLGIALPRGAFSSFHEPGKTAIFEVGDALLPDVARIVHGLFTEVLAARGCDIAVRVERDR